MSDTIQNIDRQNANDEAVQRARELLYDLHTIKCTLETLDFSIQNLLQNPSLSEATLTKIELRALNYAEMMNEIASRAQGALRNLKR